MAPFSQTELRTPRAAPEGEIGPVAEDLGDVPADVVTLDALAGGVVLEHHLGRVHRDDRVHVVVVPGLVVAADRLPEVAHTSSRVMCIASTTRS